MTAPPTLNWPLPPIEAPTKGNEDGSNDLPSEQEVDLDNPNHEEALRSTQWKDLFNFTTRKHLPILVLAVALSILTGLAVPANAYLLGKIFDAFSKQAAGTITGGTLKSEVSKYSIYLLGLAAGNFVLNAAFFATWMLFGELQARSARERVFVALMKRNMTWYDQRKNGVAAIVPRLQMQTRELQISVSQPFGLVLEHISSTLLSLGLALYYSWRVTLVTMAGVPVCMVVIVVLSSRIQLNVNRQTEKLEEALKYSIGAIKSIETVKSFNGQDLEVWKYTRIARQAATYYVRQANAFALQTCVMSFFSFAMFIQGFWYGSSLLDKGETPGEVLTTFWAALMATQALTAIFPMLLVLEKGRAAGAKLRAVMVHGSKGQEESRSGLKPDHCAGDFELKNICFSYPMRPNEFALDNASLFFAAGETTFVIGKSGSGKSTIGQVLSRFYPPKSGTVTLDGNRLEDLDVEWLRRNITLVEQASVLFDGTVFRNISYGRPNFDRVTLEEVKEAAEFALLREAVNNMPDTWDTQVGAQGSSMSGGQRQRMALARARLRDTPVLILDESTSALDYINRTLIMEAIRVWRRGRTTIIITHDISQIHHDDYVYILEKGQVVQDGYRGAIERVKHAPFQKFVTIQEEDGGGQDEEEDTELTTSLTEASRTVVGDSRPRNPQRASSIYSDDWTSEGEESVQDPLHNYLDRDIVGAPRYVPSMFVEQRVEPGNRGSMILPAAMGGHFWRVLPPTSALSPPSPSESPHTRPSYFGGFDSSCEGDHGYDRYDEVLSETHRKSFSTQDYKIGLGIDGSGETECRSHSPTVHRPESIPLCERRLTHATLTIGTPVIQNGERGTPSHRTPVLLLSHLPFLGSAVKKEKKKGHDLLTYRQILSDVWPRLAWPQRLLLLIGVAACVMHAIATPVFAYVFNKLLTTFYLRGADRTRRALVYSVAILGISVVDAASSYLSHFVLEYAAQMWVHAVRETAMRTVLAQPRAFFDEPGNGAESLCESLDYHAEEMRNLVGRFAGGVLMAVLMMGTAIVWSLISSWKLSLVGLAIAPLFYTITVAFNRVSGRQEHLLNEADDAATTVLGETLVNIKTVRGLTLERALQRKYFAATRAIFTRGCRRALLCGLFFGLTDSLIFGVTALLFWYGAVLVASGSFSTPSILQVFTELTMSMTNVNVIISMIPQMGSSRDTATRLLRLASLSPAASYEAAGTTRIPRVGDIALHDLSFAYPSRPHAAVLCGLTTHIRAGTAVAVVGLSGSGKSTLAALLLKLYPPPPGRAASITLSGRDIRHLHTPTLRARVAAVGQTPTIFPASVADNIAYGLRAGDPCAARHSVRAAARSAGIEEFVDSLPDGFDTLIGDGGVGLSGGQAQRVAIARALCRRPDVLVLDEATSALDAENAGIVRETIRRLVKGRREGGRADGVGMTVIIITHAREMMEVADRVIMLDQGRLVEEGDFAELSRRKGGEFARLLKGGLEGEEDAGPPPEGAGAQRKERLRLRREKREKRESRRLSESRFEVMARSRRSGMW